MRRRHPKGKHLQHCAALLKGALKWHDTPGRYTFGLLLFVTLTGWALRPPVLLALASTKVAPIPFTRLDSDNAWADKLRMIRYDEATEQWLLSSSEGFYALRSWDDTPRRLSAAPPMSVMGQNVFERLDDGSWLCGSFAGLYVWDTRRECATDYFTHEKAPRQAGSPFGAHAVAGYSRDFACGDLTVEYYTGTDSLPMPAELSRLPISLWNVALEIHTGRIYTFLGFGKFLYITFAGLIVVWILVSGYRIRRRKTRQNRQKPEQVS